MRPTPDEVIAGVRAILKSDIAPALPRAAQPQLRRVMAVLRDGRWSEAGFDVLHENAVLARLAHDLAEGLGDLVLPQEIAPLSNQLSSAAVYSTPESFAEANEINRVLRAAISALLERAREAGLPDLDDLCATIGPVLLNLRSA